MAEFELRSLAGNTLIVSEEDVPGLLAIGFTVVREVLADVQGFIADEPLEPDQPLVFPPRPVSVFIPPPLPAPPDSSGETALLIESLTTQNQFLRQQLASVTDDSIASLSNQVSSVRNDITGFRTEIKGELAVLALAAEDDKLTPGQAQFDGLDLTDFVAFIVKAMGDVLPGVGQAGIGISREQIERLINALKGGASGGLAGIQEKLSAWIAMELSSVLSVANIGRSGGGVEEDPATFGGELATFTADSARAINGAAVATYVVVGLNMAAAASDGAMSLFGLGAVAPFQQLVQNLIWATGLSDIGGLTFRPQVAASFAPLLERFWNEKSQAQIPGQGDMIRFLVREVFQPARRGVLRSDDDLSQLYPFMRQRGFSDFWTDSFWAAHWNLLSITQLNEALHRGVIGIDEWRRQVRFNDVVPEAVPWLEQIIFSPFTRVDVRRMERLDILNDQELLQAYADIGFFAPVEAGSDGRFHARFVSQGEFDATVHKAQANVLFAKLFNALPLLRRRLSNGFVKPEDVKGELLALGLSESTAQRQTETLIKNDDTEVASKARELTTSQIVRGVKEGVITFVQGIFLLRELGWTSARAEFLLRLRITPEEALTASELGQRLIGLSAPTVDLSEEEG